MAIRKHISLTLDRAKELLEYSPNTGVFYWHVNRPGTVKKGDIAGCIATPKQRRRQSLIIGIDGRHYQAHRLAWFMTHGEWPKEQIDHINQNALDNRIANLREATLAENNRNVTSEHKSHLGYRGVSMNGRRYKAKICVDLKQIHLGTFDTPELAYAAYCEAAKKYHREFARFD